MALPAKQLYAGSNPALVSNLLPEGYAELPSFSAPEGFYYPWNVEAWISLTRDPGHRLK